jgi:hypothetical protein
MLAQLQRENGRGAHVTPTPVDITSIGVNVFPDWTAFMTS